MTCSRGAALVELAILIPLLLIITGGAIDYGIAVYRAQVMLEVAHNVSKLAYRETEGSANSANCTALLQPGGYLQTQLGSRLTAAGESPAAYTAEACIVDGAEDFIPVGGFLAGGLSLLQVKISRNSGNCSFCLSELVPLPGQLVQTVMYPIECPIASCQTLTLP